MKRKKKNPLQATKKPTSSLGRMRATRITGLKTWNYMEHNGPTCIKPQTTLWLLLRESAPFFFQQVKVISEIIVRGSHYVATGYG